MSDAEQIANALARSNEDLGAVADCFRSSGEVYREASAHLDLAVITLQGLFGIERSEVGDVPIGVVDTNLGLQGVLPQSVNLINKSGGHMSEADNRLNDVGSRLGNLDDRAKPSSAIGGTLSKARELKEDVQQLRSYTDSRVQQIREVAGRLNAAVTELQELIATNRRSVGVMESSIPSGITMQVQRNNQYIDHLMGWH